MCGIYGVIYSRNITDVNIKEAYAEKFVELAVANSKRGEDATGAFRIEKNESITLFKRSKPIWNNLFNDNWLKTLRVTPKTVCLIGHNRERSVKTWSNEPRFAHPHLVGNILGVHNGTITNVSDIYKDETHDSIALFRFIGEHGINSIDKLVGSLAVCYVDYAKNHNIFYFVSSERPLHYAIENGVFIFSSEYGHLKSVLTSNVTIWVLKSKILMRVNANKNLKTNFYNIPEPAKYKSVLPTYQSGYQGTYQGGYSYPQGPSQSTQLESKRSYIDDSDDEYAWYSEWGHGSRTTLVENKEITPSLPGMSVTQQPLRTIGFSPSTNNPEEICDLCKRELHKTTVFVYNENGKFKRKQCITCKPDRCSKCKEVTSYNAENIMIEVNDAMLCRKCWMKQMNEEILPNIDPENKVHCIGCKQEMPSNCTEILFIKEMDIKGKKHLPKFVYCCISCLAEDDKNKKTLLGNQQQEQDEIYYVVDLK